MSPYPSPSTFISTSSASTRSTIATDGRSRIVIIVLSILAALLVAFILYLTISTKKRRLENEQSGPYQGTVINSEHPASQITPFGNNLQPGAKGPTFKRIPGKDMRIALRRPDGAWHFSDSRTPFSPAGVKDLDNVPSLASPSASTFSSISNGRIPSRKADEVKMESLRRRYDPEFDLIPTVPPPPAYHPDANQYHSDHVHSPT